MTKYILVRMRRSDFEKIMETKKKPMEDDLRKLTGKNVKLKIIDVFSIASNAVWDLGSGYQNKIIKTVKLKKPNFRL